MSLLLLVTKARHDRLASLGVSIFATDWQSQWPEDIPVGGDTPILDSALVLA